MHLNLSLSFTALLATAALARPSTLSTRMDHELTKRHFWCNGVDSETICPEGDTMVPIDAYACDQISNAGRMNQISPPVNGETSTTCQQQQQQQAPTRKETAPAVGSGSLESTPFINGSASQKHWTCTEVGGGSGGSVMLNCTTRA